MDIRADLEEKLGLKSADLAYNLSKEELFHAAIQNDRGRVREGGPDDEQKAYPTKLGTDGPLVFYTDPTCTGRPVQDTFAVAWPEFEGELWWKKAPWLNQTASPVTGCLRIAGLTWRVRRWSPWPSVLPRRPYSRR